MHDGISIIIPTLNGGSIFLKCLDGIARQKYRGKIELIIIDSGSTDGTIEAARAAGAVIRKIDQNEFSHSRTRNEAVGIAKYEKVILMVQDAIPISDDLIEIMNKALADYDVVAAYGAQTPHDDADLYARFEVEQHREHLGNNPVIQHLKREENLKSSPYENVLRNIRLDNVCAIYRTAMLRRYPFPNVSFAEDMAWAAEVMRDGHAILYHPDIVVKHSHNRTPDYRFRRALANSIACVQILGRVKYDVSHMHIPLYQSISERVNQFTDRLLEESTDGNGAEGGDKRGIREIYYFLGRHLYTFLKKNRRFVRFSTLLPLQNFWADAYGNLTEQHLRYVIKLISGKYKDAARSEIQDCIYQVAATMMGTLLGEMYASYKLKGKSYPELEQLVNQYIGGV